jgi:hypothetical protein
MRAHAAVAQLVEQRIRNAKVASSTPASGTILNFAARLIRTKSGPFCMKKSIWLLALLFSGLVLAEDDGEELLLLMRKPATAPIALEHIDDVRARWDGSVFCIAKGNDSAPVDPQRAAFSAVKIYLEDYPGERYRPRRYLIIQGLRAAYPCSGTKP